MPAGPARLVHAVTAWRSGAGVGPAAMALARMLAARGVEPPAVLGGSP